MSNNYGYDRTNNEHRMENIRLTGSFVGSGEQFKINRPNNGPILSLGGNPNYDNDLLLITKPNGKHTFRVDHDGTVWIKDRDQLILQTVPVGKKGILFTDGSETGLNVANDKFNWDNDTMFFGVGTNNPQNRIHLKDGDLNIENGSLKMNNRTSLNPNMCVLNATNGDDNEEEGLILGEPNSDGCWRVVVSNGDLIVQKKISGEWCTRGKFS